MNILMFHGRAGGHNIMPFLEYFNNHTEHNLTFIYSNDRTYYPEVENIKFLKFSFKPASLITALRTIGKKYDLIWFHGGHSAVIFYLFTKFRSKKSTFIFNVWNEWLIHKAKKGGVKGKMFQYGIKNSDIIHCNWHGTAEVLKATGWNNNIKVFYWGLHRENFKDHQEAESAETKEFIQSLPKDKTKFFFPKSISPNSRHDLIIEAAAQLVENGYKDFIIYFWMGNTNDPELLEKYAEAIHQQDLQGHVILKSHGFLSFGDMQLIWKQMDVGLQIAANEQLSTTFLEPQFYQKEIIVTDIFPYRLYNKVFNLEIPLIALTSEAIYQNILAFIKGKKTDDQILTERANVVRNNFNLSENIKTIIKHYSKG